MAFALVSHTSAQAGGAVNITTLAIDTTGATLIVAVTDAYAPAGNNNQLSDSKGNTWNELTTQTQANGIARIYYAWNPTVGSGHTFTLGGQYDSVCVAAFSGAQTSSDPFDAQSGNGIASGAASISPGSITPAVGNELVIFGACGNWGGTLSVDTGTILENLPASVAFAASLAYSVQTAATAINPTFSWTGGASPATAVIASFKAAAGGGGTLLTIDAAGASEILSALRRDGVPPLAWSALLGADIAARLEISLAAGCDGAALAEILAGIRTDDAAAAELVANLKRDGAAALSFLGNLRRDLAPQIEIIGATRRDQAAPVEINSSLYAVSGDAVVPLEIVSSLKSITGDGVVPVEFGANARRDEAARVEVSAASRVDIAASIETVSLARFDQASAIEQLVAVRRDNAPPVEHGVGVRRDLAGNLESLLGARFDARASLETLAITYAVASDAAVALEIRVVVGTQSFRYRKIVGQASRHALDGFARRVSLIGIEGP